MSDIDPSGGVSRLHSGEGSASRIFGGTALPATGSPASASPDGNETLAWLSGNRNPDRRKGIMRPTGPGDAIADRVLGEAPPADPVEAAQKRASVLADLRKEAPRDPRVRAVFEIDPIVAEDASNGNLVTQAMLAARLDVFDLVLELLDRPALVRGARSRASVTLKTAYSALSDDAQVEWALSEVRLEESKAFLAQRSERDRGALARQLAATMAQDDLWVAARAFSMAAHLGVGRNSGAAGLADLLEMRDEDG